MQYVSNMPFSFKKLLPFAVIAAISGFFACPAVVQGAASPSSDATVTLAPVNDVGTNETPLMIIRFNQAHVNYGRALYDTLSTALQSKPSVKFEVVSVAPKAHNPENQPRYDQIASKNTRKVLAAIHQMGMPESRISLVSASDDVTSTEVRIYVR